MDNTRLNEEELYQLITFIKKHGFREALTITEILDHFACKVEEKMDQYPEMTLDQAMNAAHSDFGPLGFLPVVKTYEVAAKNKYKAIYNSEFKTNLANPFYVTIAVLSSFLFYRCLFWAERNNYKHFLGMNDAVVVFTLCYLFALLFLTYKFEINRRQNPVAKIISNLWVGLFLGLDPIHHFKYDTSEFAGFALLYALLCWYLVMRHFAIYTTAKKANDDSLIIYKYLENLKVRG
jgi:hypothetical protein